MLDRAGAAVLLSPLRLQPLALPTLWGWAAAHVVESQWCLFFEGGHKSPQTSAPTVFLAWEERDVTEGVKRSRTGDKTNHAAGPSCTGSMAPLITLSVVPAVNSV